MYTQSVGFAITGNPLIPSKRLLPRNGLKTADSTNEMAAAEYDTSTAFYHDEQMSLMLCFRQPDAADFLCRRFARRSLGRPESDTGNPRNSRRGRRKRSGCLPEQSKRPESASKAGTPAGDGAARFHVRGCVVGRRHAGRSNTSHVNDELPPSNLHLTKSIDEGRSAPRHRAHGAFIPRTSEDRRTTRESPP